MKLHRSIGDGWAGFLTRGPEALFLAAALVVALVRAIEPFEHGIWLVAYLFLVGFAAQLLLRRGELGLLASSGSPPPAAARWQVVLWNAGSVAVPAGVLADARLLVVAGAVCLLAALGLFWRSLRRSRGPDGNSSASMRRGYAAVILFMAASTFVGTALAWDTPWY
jgi:hypothetical protein